MAKRLIDNQKILWIDLEMTGLDASTDKILELGAVVTDWDMEIIDELDLVLKQDDQFIKNCFDKSVFWQDNPQTAEALIKQNQSGLTQADFTKTLLKFVATHFSIDPTRTGIVLAGNTIRADRAFIDTQLPELAQLLHYRMLDVSAFKVLFEAHYHKKFIKPENHRANQDIKGSIAELKYYMKHIKV